MVEGDLENSEQLPCSVRAAVFGCTTVFRGHSDRWFASNGVKVSATFQHFILYRVIGSDVGADRGEKYLSLTTDRDFCDLEEVLTDKAC